LKLQKRHRQFLLSAFAVAFPAVLLILCLRKFDLQLFLTQMKEVHWAYLLLATGATLGILVALATQWRLFLPPGRPVPFPRMFQVVSLFAMLVNTVPFWGGHAFAIYLMGVKEKVGKTAALSVITLEQIADGFAKILVLAGVAFFCPFPEWMKAGAQGLVLLVLGVYLILFIFAYRFRRDPARDELFKPIGWRRLLSFVALWAHHLHALRSFRKMMGGILLAVTMKGCELLAIFLVQISFGVDLPLYAPLLVLGALSLATMLPLSPGRLGVFEATVYWVYHSLGVNPTLALSLGLFIHMVHTLPFLLVGYAVSLKLGFRKKEALDQASNSLVLAGES